MRRLISLIRSAAAYFRLRCLEAHLQGQNDMLAITSDRQTRQSIILARAATRRAHERETSAYIALRRIARSRSWRAA